MYTDATSLTPVPHRGAPLDTARSPRAAFALEHGRNVNLPFGVSRPRPHGGRPQPAGRKRARTSPR